MDPLGQPGNLGTVQVRSDVYIGVTLPRFWQILANSLEYPERIQRGIEWTQFSKTLFGCSLIVCLQI